MHLDETVDFFFNRYMSFHHQTNQNYQQSQQWLGTLIENKVFKKSKIALIKASLVCNLIFFKEKKIRKIPLIFNTEKWLKWIRIVQCFRRLLIIFGKSDNDMVLWKKCLFSLDFSVVSCPTWTKKSWTVSNL